MAPPPYYDGGRGAPAAPAAADRAALTREAVKRSSLSPQQAVQLAARADLIGCPACRARRGRRPCVCISTGANAIADPECSICAGTGESAAHPSATCDLCTGRGRVRRCLASLFEADRAAAADDPSWSGRDADGGHRGSTLYSQAMWFRTRQRGDFGRVTHAYGFHVEQGPIVTVVSETGASMHFHGFSWADGGAGPNGLANFLADAMPAVFPTSPAALTRIAGFPFEGSWQVDARLAAAPTDREK